MSTLGSPSVSGSGTPVRSHSHSELILLEESSEYEVNVLLVEDNALNMRLTVALLEKMGPHLRVDQAKNAEIAMGKLAAVAYDLILFDYFLPDGRGDDCVQELRATLGPNQHTVVFALTALTDEHTKDKCLEAGMQGVLSKPIEKQKLQSVLNQFGA